MCTRAFELSVTTYAPTYLSSNHITNFCEMAENKNSSSDSAEEEIPIPPGVLLLQRVAATHLKNIVFCATNHDFVMEKFKFDGIYAMMRHRNPHSKLETVVNEFYDRTIEHMQNKAVFVEGNILFKQNEPEIKDAIDLMIRATTMIKLPPSVDTSVLSREQMVDGTVCPTKDTIFRYKGMLYIVYGRYIYGYNSPYVRFVAQNKSTDKYKFTAEHYEDCKENIMNNDFFWELRRNPMISCDEIILPTICYSENILYANDYNYSFCILEEASNTLLAFAVYR